MDPPLDIAMADSRQRELTLTSWICTSIALFTVCAKLFTRVHYQKAVGWDDFVIGVSMVMSILASSVVQYSITLGLGKHTYVVMAEPNGLQLLSDSAKWQIMGYPFNICAFSFPNLAIAILINRILAPPPGRAWALLGLCMVQITLAMISIVLIYTQCTPTAFLWDRSIPDGRCWDPSVFNNFNYFVTAFTTLTDFILAVYPITAFWKLNMKKSTKWGLMVMMSLTLLSAFVTLMKAVYLHLFMDRTDPMYNLCTLIDWGFVEQNVVIVAASAPTLRPLFRHLFRGGGDKETEQSYANGSALISSNHGTSFFRSRSDKVRVESVSDEVPLGDAHAFDGDSQHSLAHRRHSRGNTSHGDSNADDVVETKSGKRTLPVSRSSAVADWKDEEPSPDPDLDTTRAAKPGLTLTHTSC